jgi:DNA-binding response OmpR family regulator
VDTSAPQRRVLVVDDEKAIADSLVLIFNQRGYQARAAYSAEEAVAMLDEWPPMLAVLDVILPKMNGIDLAILLKADVPYCEVVLISGQLATSALAQRAAENGRNFYIHAKPIHPLDLLSAAENLLSRPGLDPDLLRA